MRVLLFSAGIESTCLAYMLKPDVCFTVDYGQRCSLGETEAARSIAQFLKIDHHVQTVAMPGLGSGELAGTKAIDSASIPEFWPFRNQFLITVAAMKYADQSHTEILIGSTRNDATHRDGTAQFISQINDLLQMQEGGLKVSAPAIDIESIDLIKESKIDVDYLDMTFSCFRSSIPCGQCRGCIKNESLRTAYFDENPSCKVK